MTKKTKKSTKKKSCEKSCAKKLCDEETNFCNKEKTTGDAKPVISCSKECAKKSSPPETWKHKILKLFGFIR